MTTSTPEKQDGLKALNDAIEVIKEKITTLGGVFAIQMAVRIKFLNFITKLLANSIYYDGNYNVFYFSVFKFVDKFITKN